MNAIVVVIILVVQRLLNYGVAAVPGCCFLQRFK